VTTGVTNMSEEAIIRFDKRAASKKVITDHIADGAVTTPKIADGAVTNAKIAANAVTKDKILGGGLACAVADQSLNRSANTTYQNTTGKTIIIIASVEYVGAASSSGYADIVVGPTDPPDILENNVSCDLALGTIIFAIVGIVPPGYYYRLNTSVTGSATMSVSQWLEAQLSVG
jgi:hypothetical protein